jgi:hypothetical protein
MMFESLFEMLIVFHCVSSAHACVTLNVGCARQQI